MAIQEKCRLLDHREIAPNHFRLKLESAYISSHALPGQFVLVRVADELDPLLRRPLGIHRASPEHKTFELLYEVVGKGTQLLSQAKIGSELDILGPLGTGFNIDKTKTHHIIVGGGMGVAPLLYLGSRLTTHTRLPAGTAQNSLLITLLGANTRQKVLCEQEFKDLGAEVEVATDDGSYGKKGFVSDLLLYTLDKFGIRHSALGIIYACGPKPMLKAISEIAFQHKIDCQVSVEQRMACGIGTCLGCVIETKTGYKKVCDDGPVFDSKEIIWSN